MVLNIYPFDYSKQRKFHFLLSSDLHVEDWFFDKDLLYKQFDEAVEKKARIFMNGDIMSMILPQDLKRYTSGKDQVTGTDSLVNVIVGKVFELLKPYVEYIDEIGCGNHETAVLKYHSQDATLMLIGRLNGIRKNPLPIRHGGFSGWIRLLFRRNSNGKSSEVRRYDIFRDHGKGGSAEVTKGMIDLQRLQGKTADLIWISHKHTVISTQLERNEGISSSNKLYSRMRRGLVTGCYKRPLKTYEGKVVRIGDEEQPYDINTHGYILDYGEQKMRVTEGIGGAFLELKIGKNKTIESSITA